MTPEIGASYTVECPFLRDVHSQWDVDGPEYSLTWRPGVEFRPAPPYGEDYDAVAHATGFVNYRVVDIHRLPKPYPARVFFVRQWVTPEGKIFGRTNLRITTLEAFKRRLAGYRPAGEANGWLVEDLSPDEIDGLLARARQ
jgi:hypothetical protein